MEQVLYHQPAGGTRQPLATEVEIADSVLSRMRGLIGRSQLTEGAALVMDFDRVSKRSVHMVGVTFPITVAWVDGTTVTHCKRLQPWIGFGRGSGNRIIELPAKMADTIDPGDELLLVGS